MPFNNTKHRYGAVSGFFHWSMALIVMGLLCLGLYMVGMDYSPLKLDLYMLHKSFGMVILAMVVLRLAWRFYQPQPEPLPTHRPWEKTLSKTIHAMLYIGLIGMPLSGWIMSSSGEFPNSFFDLFPVPDLVGKNDALFQITRRIHEVAGLCLVAAIGLHFAGAMKHSFIDRDRTLRRMMPEKMPEGGYKAARFFVLGTGLVFLAFAGFLIAADFVRALTERNAGTETRHAAQETAARPVKQSREPAVDDWMIKKDESRIGFSVSVYGKPFTGEFKTYDARIRFDRNNLNKSHVRVRISVGSVESGSAERDGYMVSPAWFHTDKYPDAVFEAHSFREGGESDYIAGGTLTMRGVTRDVTLPFNLDIYEENGIRQARAAGVLTVSRLDYGIGQGQWESTDVVGEDVTISIDVTALQK